MTDTPESTPATTRHLRFDTLAISYKAEADFWRNRALILQDDLNKMAEEFSTLSAAYDALKKNTKPTKGPASPTTPVKEE